MSVVSLILSESEKTYKLQSIKCFKLSIKKLWGLTNAWGNCESGKESSVKFSLCWVQHSKLCQRIHFLNSMWIYFSLVMLYSLVYTGHTSFGSCVTWPNGFSYIFQQRLTAGLSSCLSIITPLCYITTLSDPRLRQDFLWNLKEHTLEKHLQSKTAPSELLGNSFECS